MKLLQTENNDVREYLSPKAQDLFDHLISVANMRAGIDCHKPNMMLGLLVEEIIGLQIKNEELENKIDNLQIAIKLGITNE